MKLGRIRHQYKECVVGFDGEVATGDRLINVMRQIEGKEVEIRWIDDHQGNVLRAHVHTPDGAMVCELLGDLSYQRATLEKTDEDRENEALTSLYARTVDDFIRRGKQDVKRVTLISKPSIEIRPKSFVMPPVLTHRSTTSRMPISEDFNDDEKPLKRPSKPISTSTASRFT